MFSYNYGGDELSTSHPDVNVVEEIKDQKEDINKDKHSTTREKIMHMCR